MVEKRLTPHTHTHGYLKGVKNTNLAAKKSDLCCFLSYRCNAYVILGWGKKKEMKDS